MTNRILSVSIALISILVAGSASADDSTRGAFYVQGSPLGVGVAFYPGADTVDPVTGQPTSLGGGASGAYRVDVEGGYHFSGRHDGFVLALRQAFYFSGGSLGSTTARAGWDIPISLADGKMELTIAPYAHVGIGYAFAGGDPFFHWGVGADGKLFFLKDLGLYAFVRPIEFSMFINQAVLPAISFGAGMGFAF